MSDRETILRMACDAGLRNSNPGAAQEILRFAAMVIEAERGACAKICADYSTDLRTSLMHASERVEELKSELRAQQVAVPQGYALVPVEPTPEMLGEVDEDVGGHCYSCSKWPASDDDCRHAQSRTPAAKRRSEMTDRELLELAAKAAGELHLVPYKDEWLSDPHCEAWNPLRFDGDALRLAVKLGIDVLLAIPGEPDPYAAARRAIVIVAAEIGRDL